MYAPHPRLRLQAVAKNMFTCANRFLRPYLRERPMSPAMERIDGAAALAGM